MTTSYVDQSALGSTLIAGVAAEKDLNEQVKTVAIVVDRNFSPPRLLVELPDRALRDLGVITVDGTVSVDPSTLWSYHEDSSSALSGTEVKAAPAAGVSIYVTDIIFSLGQASAVNVKFLEGATVILGPYYLEDTAGRGLAIQFKTPKKVTAATALTVTTSAAVAHSLDVMGYTA